MKRPQFHKIVKEVVNADGSVRYTLQYNPQIFSNAKCIGINTELFYPNQEKFSTSEEHYISSRICGGCPVREACLEWGLVHEPYGIWGGTTPFRRRLMRRAMHWIINDITLPVSRRK